MTEEFIRFTLGGARYGLWMAALFWTLTVLFASSLGIRKTIVFGLLWFIGAGIMMYLGINPAFFLPYEALLIAALMVAIYVETGLDIWK